ncbi:mastermind-like protein 3 [Arapaima gigas]
MAARNQALQNIRNARLLQQQQQQQHQSQGMLQMGPMQMPGSVPGAGPGVAPSSDVNMVYGGQQGLYGPKPGMNQMLQHPNQSGMGMAHNPAQAPRQPVAGQGVGMAAGYGQGMMINPAVSQQQMKGPAVNQTMAKAQVQRLQGMMGGGGQGAQGWPQQQQQQQQQQQNLQALSGRTTGEMVAFNNNPAYALQPGQPRMTKQHFPQGMNQPMVDPRAMNPAMGGQMMPHMVGQPRTNQPRPMVMPGMAQGVPNLAAFNQGTGQPMAGSGGSYVQSSQQQTYQRTPSQDLSYSYGIYTVKYSSKAVVFLCVSLEQAQTVWAVARQPAGGITTAEFLHHTVRDLAATHSSQGLD